MRRTPLQRDCMKVHAFISPSQSASVRHNSHGTQAASLFRWRQTCMKTRWKIVLSWLIRILFAGEPNTRHLGLHIPYILMVLSATTNAHISGLYKYWRMWNITRAEYSESKPHGDAFADNHLLWSAHTWRAWLRTHSLVRARWWTK